MSFWILNGIKVLILLLLIIMSSEVVRNGGFTSKAATSKHLQSGLWDLVCTSWARKTTAVQSWSEDPHSAGSSPNLQAVLGRQGEGARPIWRQLMFLWLNFESLDPIWFYGGQPCFMIFLGAVLMMVQLEVFHVDLQCAHRSLAAIEWALITWSVENPSLDHLDFKNEATLIDSDRF